MRNQKVEKSFDQLRKQFGALIAVGDHQQRALGRLPQQDEIQRFGGRRQSSD